MAGIVKEEVESVGSSTDSDGGGAIPKMSRERFYYSFCPHPLYRLVSLDTYDVNAIRGEPGGRRREEGGQEEEQEVEEEEWGWEGERGGDVQPERGAVEMLSEQNPNEDKNDSEGMEGLSTRYSMVWYGDVCRSFDQSFNRSIKHSNNQES